MKISDFISELRRALDAAAVRGTKGSAIIWTCTAPSSGFCGPTIRPRYIEEVAVGGERELSGRYGLTRRQVEKLLTAFSVTLPPEKEIR